MVCQLTKRTPGYRRRAGMKTVADIDWSVFNYPPDNTITCRCGAVFRSHCKGVWNDGNTNFIHLTRVPCPQCNRHDNVRRAESDPERVTLTR